MAEQLKLAVLCWDFDQTIGDFPGMRSLGRESSPSISLRYGIRELLTDFSEENGFCNYITSSADLGYITEGLNRTYLNTKFAVIFDNETVQATTEGKHYKPVAHSSHYSEDEMRGRMIAIGDSKKDTPLDIGGMVFVELGDSYEPFDALVVREIVTTVLDNGDGNFKNGYEKLYGEAKPLDDPTRSSRRQSDIGNDIAFTMEYRKAKEVNNGEQKVPVIYNIRSTTHKKPFQSFF